MTPHDSPISGRVTIPPDSSHAEHTPAAPTDLAVTTPTCTPTAFIAIERHYRPDLERCVRALRRLLAAPVPVPPPDLPPKPPTPPTPPTSRAPRPSTDKEAA
jgi:hypothetical protein